MPAVEPNLPQVYRDAGLLFTGANALNPEPAAALSRLRRDALPQLRQPGRLQRAPGRAAAPLLEKLHLRRLLHALARETDSAGTTDATHPFDPAAYDYALANFDRTHYFVANYVWNVPKGGGLLGGGAFARALLDNWTVSGISGSRPAAPSS